MKVVGVILLIIGGAAVPGDPDWFELARAALIIEAGLVLYGFGVWDERRKP